MRCHVSITHSVSLIWILKHCRSNIVEDIKQDILCRAVVLSNEEKTNGGPYTFNCVFTDISSGLFGRSLQSKGRLSAPLLLCILCHHNFQASQHKGDYINFHNLSICEMFPKLSQFNFVLASQAGIPTCCPLEISTIYSPINLKLT